MVSIPGHGYGICGGPSSTKTGFAPSTSAFPFQYHSTTYQYSSSSTRYSYHKDKRARPGKLKKNENRVSLQEKSYFTFIGSQMDKRHGTSVITLVNDVSSAPLCQRQ